MAPPTSEDVVLLAMLTRGEVIVPENKRSYQFECTKGHNVMLHATNKPLMFLMCHDEEDVKLGLEFALKHGLTISIRCGAHGVDGDSYKDKSFVIDLSRMNSCEYDEATGDLIYGPGCLLKDLTVCAHRHGRIVPVGVAPPTGAAGLTLHGGLGWLGCKVGLSVDNLTKIRMLTADGKFRECSINSTDPEEKDLFFAARGAAGSMGIVTEMRIRTQPSEVIIGGLWMMLDDEQYSSTKELTKKAIHVVKKQEEEDNRTLTGGIYMVTVPPLPEIPEKHHGKACSLMFLGAFGDDEDTQKLMKEFVDREVIFGKPPAPMPFGIFNQLMAGMFLNFPPLAPYWKGAMLRDIPGDEDTEKYCDMWASERQPYMGGSFVGVELGIGKGGRCYAESVNEGVEHCVAPMRKFVVHFNAFFYVPPEDEMFNEARKLSRKLVGIFDGQPQTSYINLSSEIVGDDESNQHMSRAFTAVDRLKAIKKRIDPNGVFNRKFINI